MGQDLAMFLRPQDCGVVAWTSNPQNSRSANYVISGGNLGKLLLYAFMSGLGGTVSNLSYNVVTAGTGVVNTYLGIYDMNGNQVGGSTPDQSANMMAVGTYTAALSTPAVLVPGTMYRVGMVMQTASQSPGWTGFGASYSAAITNMGMPASKSLAAMTGSGLTALPATYDPNALTPIAGGLIAVMS
jgi:hypothetical protein